MKKALTIVRPKDDFTTATTVGTFDELFATPFTANENLRICPAELKGDYDRLAVRLALQMNHQIPIEWRRGRIGFGGERLFREWSPRNKAKYIDGQPCTRGEEIAFEGIRNDFNQLVKRGMDPILWLWYSFEQDPSLFHLDGGPSRLLRSYNKGSTRFVSHEHTLSTVINNRPREICNDASQVYLPPVGYYTLHTTISSAPENSDGEICPSVHESLILPPSKTPRLFLDAGCPKNGMFGMVR